MKCAGNANALHGANPVSPFWDEKSAPWGRARGDGPGVAVLFQECGIPVLASLKWRLSPLFSQDAQIFIFPPP
jgi:hypothetical protein